MPSPGDQLRSRDRRDRVIVAVFFVGVALFVATLLLGPVPMTGGLGLVLVIGVGWLMLRV